MARRDITWQPPKSNPNSNPTLLFYLSSITTRSTRQSTDISSKMDPRENPAKATETVVPEVEPLSALLAHPFLQDPIFLTAAIGLIFAVVFLTCKWDPSWYPSHAQIMKTLADDGSLTSKKRGRFQERWSSEYSARWTLRWRQDCSLCKSGYRIDHLSPPPFNFSQQSSETHDASSSLTRHTHKHIHRPSPHPRSSPFQTQLAHPRHLDKSV